MTFEEAASLPLVALTAWQALVEIGKLRANQRVLIHAGSGGVGSVAIQLARHIGATVFTTVGQRNVELVKRLGANVAIDYRSERFEDVAKDCDVVLDSAGGDTLVRCFECVKPGGVVVSINSSTPSPAFARSWGLNPMLVFAIRVLSRKATAAARKHNARYEYLFVRADGEQLREIARLGGERRHHARWWIRSFRSSRCVKHSRIPSPGGRREKWSSRLRENATAA